jgi:acyl-coenzyme A thioesterase PaaI-like protein
MDINTHKKANMGLLGKPVKVETGKSAVVELVANEYMVVDDEGLIHGGFTFGLADYAAMLAVNDPYVVLGGADVKFTSPVKMGQKMVVEAIIDSEEKRKRTVRAEIKVDDRVVFKGTFTCFVLDKHVFDA